MVAVPDILQLEDTIASLPPEERFIFQRIFNVASVSGQLRPPESMRSWIESQFGSVEDVLEQRIIKVTNVVTLEGVLFNWLRSRRPIWRNHRLQLDEELITPDHDPLCNPYLNTPEDVFGRVEGKYCVTASNVAKFDGFHALVVFREHHPLRFTWEMLHDYIDTGRRWADKAHELDPSAKYYLFIWNCLWRAGASLEHGHAQVMLGRDMHYAKIEHLRRSALHYQSLTGDNYFQDLYQAHAVVGCGFENKGVQIMAYLTPIKEHEVILMAPEMNDSLKMRIYETLTCYQTCLGISSFNLVIYQPPIAPTEENWEGFPVIVRIVDRGDPDSRTADFGSMELYAASVVSSDPFLLARTLKQYMEEA